MKHQTKLSQKPEYVAEQQTQSNTDKAFASSDELLRFDAAQTAVPPEIARRLGQSICNEPRPSHSWWQRWLNQE
jgi:hypothetical protein